VERHLLALPSSYYYAQVCWLGYWRSLQEEAGPTRLYYDGLSFAATSSMVRETIIQVSRRLDVPGNRASFGVKQR